MCRLPLYSGKQRQTYKLGVKAETSMCRLPLYSESVPGTPWPTDVDRDRVHVWRVARSTEASEACRREPHNKHAIGIQQGLSTSYDLSECCGRHQQPVIFF